MAKAFLGTCIDAPTFGSLRILENQLVIVDQDGRISYMSGFPVDSVASVLETHGVKLEDLHRLQEGQFLTPGFIDLHVHAPQYVFTGTATDLPLFDWLAKRAFPAEKQIQDPEIAKDCYSRLIRRLLRNGTTTAVYYPSLHVEPTRVLIDLLEQMHQRAVVGKVSMDLNSPVDYIESTQEALKKAEEVILYVKSKRTGLLLPSVIPRFILTCTQELMQGLALLAEKHGTYVQSHISESLDEVQCVKKLTSPQHTDTSVFQAAGLLRRGAIMAHGTLLSDDELALLASTGTAIAHCPLSNFFFGDRMFSVQNALALGVQVGLGTDIAGGYSPSMLNAIRTAVINGQALRTAHLQQHGPDSKEFADILTVNYKEAFWLATAGGAAALGLQDNLGSFEVGKCFDALLVDTSSGAAFDVFASDDVGRRFEKFINLGDDRHILQVFVNGVCVAAAGMPGIAAGGHMGEQELLYACHGHRFRA